MTRLITLFAVVISHFLCLSSIAKAQQVAVKSNLLQWGIIAPNIGVEWAASRKFTLDLSLAYQPFDLKNDQKTYKFWLVQPELRYWFCERFNGSFAGIHAHGGEFNIGGIKLPFGMAKKLKEHRYDGYYYGGGFTFGHHWILSSRWSIEALVGVGYTRIEYDKHRCTGCSTLVKSGHTNYWGPTKAAVSFIYFIK